MLRIEGLEKSYGHSRVLRGVRLEIDPGQVLGLLGPNGAGKTTLVSIVAGLRRADAGSVTVGDVDALRYPHLARPLFGLAPQELGIYPTMTTRRNLVLFGELAGLSGAELRRRVDQVAEALDLTALLERKAGVLSGGQKRRLHTAMAMLHRPRLLFLDEPTVGADIESRRRILELVKDLASQGCAVCYATHYLPEIEELDATVAVLDRGRIVACDSVANLVTQHGTPGVRLIFEDEAPQIEGFEVSGRDAFRPSSDPGVEAARVLATAAEWVSNLDSIEVVRPNLESAYLALTGRTDESENEEYADVA